MTTNIFKIFSDLLPARPLQVGSVVHVDGDICTVELPGGGRLQARGTATVGQHVFVRDSVIEGEAPALPLVEIEV